MSVSNPDPLLSDADLVARTLGGDSDAADALVRRYYRAAFAVAMSVVGNRQDAEDVCQDAFVKVLDRLEDCRDSGRVAPWLLTVVRNRALSHRSYSKVRETLELLPEIAEAPDSPLNDATTAELGDRLQVALAVLNPTQREVVLLHDLDGWTHGQIAEALKMTEVRSRQHLFVARKRLREELGTPLLREYTHD